jgi:hypothetical protein
MFYLIFVYLVAGFAFGVARTEANGEVFNLKLAAQWPVSVFNYVVKFF